MKKLVKISVILGIVLSLCGGIVTAAGYIGGGFRELTGKVSSSIPAVQSAKAQESLTFSPNEIGRLEFRLNSENIAFHPSDDGQIHHPLSAPGMTSPTRPTRSRAPVQMVLAPWFSPEKTLPPHSAVSLRHGN